MCLYFPTLSHSTETEGLQKGFQHLCHPVSEISHWGNSVPFGRWNSKQQLSCHIYCSCFLNLKASTASSHPPDRHLTCSLGWLLNYFQMSFILWLLQTVAHQPAETRHVHKPTCWRNVILLLLPLTILYFNTNTIKQSFFVTPPARSHPSCNHW